MLIVPSENHRQLSAARRSRSMRASESAEQVKLLKRATEKFLQTEKVVGMQIEQVYFLARRTEV